MIICFPVEKNNGAESEIYGHFGSAPGFVTFDTDTKLTGFIDNQNAQHEHGACNPAGALENSGANAVVINGIGQGAMMRLMQSGISVYQAKPGNIKSNVELFQQNSLLKLSRDMRMCGGGTHSCGH